MKEKQKEPKLTYALDSSGTMVFIGDVVKRGLACNCRCPKCKELLIARLGHEGGRQRHFAHQRGSDCHGAYMTALHMLAEQILEKEKAVMVPAYKEIDSQRLSFKDVEVEKRVERKESGTLDLTIKGVPSTVYYGPIDYVDWSVAIVVAKQSMWGPLLKMSLVLLLVVAIGMLMVWLAVRKLGTPALK